MVTTLDHQVAILQAIVANQTTPKNRDETFRSTAKALHQILGTIKLLFYVGQLFPDVEPINLVPCSAWPLAPNVFIHDTSSPAVHFSFECGGRTAGSDSDE